MAREPVLEAESSAVEPQTVGRGAVVVARVGWVGPSAIAGGGLGRNSGAPGMLVVRCGAGPEARLWEYTGPLSARTLGAPAEGQKKGRGNPVGGLLGGPRGDPTSPRPFGVRATAHWFLLSRRGRRWRNEIRALPLRSPTDLWGGRVRGWGLVAGGGGTLAVGAGESYRGGRGSGRFWCGR